MRHLIVIITLMMPLHLFANPDAKKIVAEALQRDQGFVSSSVNAKMVLQDKQGVSSTRDMTIKTLEGKDDEDKTLIIFQSPKDIKGTALLTHTKAKSDDLQWLYLPSIRRTKRISSSNRSGPFVGSEFAYEDLVTHVLDKYSYKYLRKEKLNGRECHVIEETPNDKSSGYSKQVAWLDVAELRLEQMHFYDKKNTHFKTLELTGYQKYLGKHWRPASSKMINRQTGKSTAIDWLKYEFKTGLKDADFNNATLQRLR